VGFNVGLNKKAPRKALFYNVVGGVDGTRTQGNEAGVFKLLRCPLLIGQLVLSLLLTLAALPSVASTVPLNYYMFVEPLRRNEPLRLEGRAMPANEKFSGVTLFWCA
jgi:hypothetical protein